MHSYFVISFMIKCEENLVCDINSVFLISLHLLMSYSK